MAILLPDLRAAFTAVVDSVIIEVTVPVATTPGTINQNDQFTFSVTAKNTAANSVQLINVVYHVSITPQGRAQLKVPSAPIIARSGAGETAPQLTVSTFVDEMYLFPPDRTLDVNDSDTILLAGKALALGSVIISAHVHCDPNLEYLFPPDETSPNKDRLFSVI